jgi:hypothetical protein
MKLKQWLEKVTALIVNIGKFEVNDPSVYLKKLEKDKLKPNQTGRKY